MHPALVAFLVALGLVILWLVRLGMKAGKRQLSETDLRRCISVHRVTPEDPGEGWAEVGRKTTVRGLDVRFDHDDDPEARAVMPLPEGMRSPKGRGLANVHTVTLAEDFTEEHCHTSGWVFRVSIRGTAPVVGSQVRLQMSVGSDGVPYGGVLENDDDDRSPAVGGWIEIEWAEFLQAPDGR